MKINKSTYSNAQFLLILVLVCHKKSGISHYGTHLVQYVGLKILKMKISQPHLCTGSLSPFHAHHHQPVSGKRGNLRWKRWHIRWMLVIRPISFSPIDCWWHFCEPSWEGVNCNLAEIRISTARMIKGAGWYKSKEPVTQKQPERFYQWESLHRRVAADVSNIKHKSEIHNGNSRKWFYYLKATNHLVDRTFTKI